jgi:hypothetical protein
MGHLAENQLTPIPTASLLRGTPMTDLHCLQFKLEPAIQAVIALFTLVMCVMIQEAAAFAGV